MADADLYLGSVDVSRYLSAEECRRCGAGSCRDLVERLRSRGCDPGSLALPAHRQRGLAIALGLEPVLPHVPALGLPRPATTGLLEINDPRPGDPVLVTGNSTFTEDVILAVVSTTASPFFLLFVDTRGDTLDMALVLGSFTPARVRRSLEAEGAGQRVGRAPLVLPGLASDLRMEVESQTGLAAEVGPVCAAELPLFFGDRWLRA